jgi:hypothetical protein
MELSGTNGDFSYQGYCETVIIAGTEHKVVLGDVGKLEIAGSNHDITVGNVNELSVAGGYHAVRTGNIGTADIAGSDHDLYTGNIGSITVYGGNNDVKADRIGTVVEVAGSGHLIEYRQLNPNTRNPKRPTHPSRRIYGSGNLVRHNPAAR